MNRAQMQLGLNRRSDGASVGGSAVYPLSQVNVGTTPTAAPSAAMRSSWAGPPRTMVGSRGSSLGAMGGVGVDREIEIMGGIIIRVKMKNYMVEIVENIMKDLTIKILV